MSAWHERTAPVRRHPRLRDLGRDGPSQLRAEAFAHDLAAWFAGAPRARLGALARVVTAVGGPVMRDTRALCHGLPLLGIEAGARAAALFWPLLELPPEPEPEPEDPEEGDGADDGADEGDPAEDARALVADLADGDPGDDPDVDALVQLLARLGDDPGEAAQSQLAPVGRAAFEGAEEGEALAQALEQLVPGVGWGLSPGALHATLAERLDRLPALFERLPELRRIADRLGRLEHADASAAHDVGGGEEITGVHLGGEVTGALPSELALLGGDDTEDLFYARLLERRLVSLELSGQGLHGVTRPERRGPVLACIDTSGSMSGAPEAVAKALVLAVCRRVLPQGRTVHLLLFGSRGEATELRLRLGRGGLEQLLDFLARGFEGGTDFDTPLLRALALLEERDLERADVLVVTDGHARAAREVAERVEVARQTRGVRVFSTLVGKGDDRGVAPFSDEVWRVDADGSGTIRFDAWGPAGTRRRR